MSFSSTVEACAYLLDTEGDDAVSFENFNDWIKSGDRVRNIMDPEKWSLLKAALDLFKQYDIDQSRSLDRVEFQHLFTDRGGDISQVETAYTNMDIDGNGNISFGEFLLWLNWVNSDDFLLPIQQVNSDQLHLNSCCINETLKVDVEMKRDTLKEGAYSPLTTSVHWRKAPRLTGRLMWNENSMLIGNGFSVSAGDS